MSLLQGAGGHLVVDQIEALSVIISIASIFITGVFYLLTNNNEIISYISRACFFLS